MLDSSLDALEKSLGVVGVCRIEAKSRILGKVVESVEKVGFAERWVSLSQLAVSSTVDARLVKL